MHILFLSDNFPPEVNAPATRTHEHAREWVRLGHSVTVITCAPNFPDGKVFSGYRNRWYQSDEVDGVSVVRVKTFITANEGFTLRILDYISFAVMGSVAGLFQKRPDVIVSTSPQFFCACGGWVLSMMRRTPWVFELRDIWPASIEAVGAMKSGIVIRALESLELFLYRRADRIVALTNSFKGELIERGINGAKIDVVTNGLDYLKYSPAERKNSYFANAYGLTEKFVVGYVGTHGMAHALDSVLMAAERVRCNEKIRFLFVGGGAERARLEQLVSERRLKNVIMMPLQPKEAMPLVWSLCDVSLISLRNTSAFTKVIPSKIFESMGMGLPMLLTCPEGEATKLVKNSASGVAVEPENPVALAECITALCLDSARLAKLAGASARAAKMYDRKRLAALMLESLKLVCKT